jgi:predicted amidophosphoribosyltransferase
MSNDPREHGGTYLEPPSNFRSESRDIICSDCGKQMEEEEANYGSPEAPICPQCFREAMDSNLQNEI